MQGLVDNWNNYTQKSLNKTKRQRELLRVAHENQVQKFVQKIYFSVSKHTKPWLNNF